MTFLSWLNQNYNNLLILSNKIDKQNGDEVLHFTLEKFISKKDTTFLDDLEDKDKLKYISRTLKLQATSHTSQFFREFKRYTILSKDVILEQAEEEYEEDSVEQIQLKFIEEELKKMNWFSALLWNRYIQKEYSAQVLADELVIPLSTVQYHLRKVKKTIRDNWNKNKGNYGL
jgi:hypothetical protein